jgi:hypothetical protein
MAWDYVSELQPPMGLLFNPQMIYKLRWNDTDKGNSKNAEKRLSKYHFAHQKFHIDWPGREHGPLRQETSH